MAWGDHHQDITQLYGIPTGVGVVAVEQGSPAEKAGIQQGDVITQFDGRAVANQQQLSDTLQYYKAGETVDVTLQRADNGKYAGQTVSVTLGSAKDMPQESGASSTSGELRYLSILDHLLDSENGEGQVKAAAPSIWPSPQDRIAEQNDNPSGGMNNEMRKLWQERSQLRISQQYQWQNRRTSPLPSLCRKVGLYSEVF